MAAVFSAWNIMLLPIQFEDFGAAGLTGLFWGSNKYSFFPFFTWMFYPIAGYLFGSLLIRCANKKKFYAVSGLIAGIVFFGGSYLFNVLLGIPTGLTREALIK